MMKTMNKLLALATLLTAVTILLCSSVMIAHADEVDTFELQAVVTGIAKYHDVTMYTTTTEDGTMLAFFADDGDFRMGDLVWLEVFDGIEPEVLDVYWIVTLEWDEMFRWLDQLDR